MRRMREIHGPNARNGTHVAVLQRKKCGNSSNPLEGHTQKINLVGRAFIACTLSAVAAALPS